MKNLYELVKVNNERKEEVKDVIRSIKSCDSFYLSALNDGEVYDYSVSASVFRDICRRELKRLKKRDRVLKKVVCLKYLRGDKKRLYPEVKPSSPWPQEREK